MTTVEIEYWEYIFIVLLAFSPWLVLLSTGIETLQDRCSELRGKECDSRHHLALGVLSALLWLLYIPIGLTMAIIYLFLATLFYMRFVIEVLFLAATPLGLFLLHLLIMMLFPSPVLIFVMTIFIFRDNPHLVLFLIMSEMLFFHFAVVA